MGAISTSHIGIACSDIQFRLKDEAQTIFCGRNMDFPVPMDSKISKHLIGEKITSKAPDGSDGFSWESQYGYIGISVFGNQSPSNDKIAVDGLNTQGLSGGVLTLFSTEYQTVPEGHNHYAISQMELLDYVLGTCATVEEVQAAISDKYVWGQPLTGLPTPPALHYSFHDRNGKSLVVEFINKKPVFTENENGVLTNDPTLDEQIANLGNYNTLSCDPMPSITINGLIIPSKGPGSGTIGLPGSSDSQSRFATLSKIKELMQANAPLNTILNGINSAAHLLNRVHVIEGEQRVPFNGKICLESTLWSVIKVLGEQLWFCFYTKDNPEIKLIKVNELDFSPGTEEKVEYPISSSLTLHDITAVFNKFRV